MCFGQKSFKFCQFLSNIRVPAVLTNRTYRSEFSDLVNYTLHWDSTSFGCSGPCFVSIWTQVAHAASVWERKANDGIAPPHPQKRAKKLQNHTAVYAPQANYWNGTSKESLPRMTGGLTPSKNHDPGNQLQRKQKTRIQKHISKESGSALATWMPQNIWILLPIL